MNVSSTYSRQGKPFPSYVVMLLAIVLAMGIAFAFIFTPLTMLFGNPTGYLLLIEQSLSGILLFALPSWLNEFYYRKNSNARIFSIRNPKMRLRDWITGVIVALLGIMAVELITQVMMTYVPAPFKFLEALQDQTMEIMRQLLERDDVLSWILILLAMVVVAPIGEEMFFRGALQGWLMARTQRVHLSVWVIAVIFSAVHMEWIGFPGRLVLGAMLGYCAVYGGLHMAILVHAINNLIAVVSYKLTGSETLATGVDVIWVVLGIVGAVGLYFAVRVMRKHINNNQSLTPSVDEKVL